jgi:hypothetical protein
VRPWVFFRQAPRDYARDRQDKLTLRRTVQVRLGFNTLRVPGTRRKRLRCAWHGPLRGLVTVIHATSGLRKRQKEILESSPQVNMEW